MQPVFLGEKERSSMFTFLKLALILTWVSIGQWNAEDPVQWMLWVLWSACSSELQPWAWKHSQGHFSPCSTQEKYLHKDVICLFLFFNSVLQLLVPFSHPALDLGSWVTVSCSFPSNNNFPGCIYPQSWETSLVDVEYFGCTHKMEEG